MPYSFQLHPEADREYTAAYIWYETKRIGLGERFVEYARIKLEAIRSNPETFSSKGNIDFSEARIDLFSLPNYL